MREFLYLNDDLVNQFIAQAEGGLYDEEAERERGASDRHGDISLKVGPATAGGETATRAWTQRYLGRVGKRQKADSTALLCCYPAFLKMSICILSRALAISTAWPLRVGLLTTECYVDTPSVGRLLAQSEQLSGLSGRI